MHSTLFSKTKIYISQNNIKHLLSKVGENDKEAITKKLLLEI